MSKRQRWIGSVGLALSLLLWVLARPAQFGGSLSYVAVAGSSMEPLLHGGDLAVLRRASDYQVGDVAAYRNQDLGQVVLHRIVGQEGDKYTLKGDNNSWLDSYEPTQTGLTVRR